MEMNECMKYPAVLIQNKKAKSTSESIIFVVLEAVIVDNVLQSLKLA